MEFLDRSGPANSWHSVPATVEEKVLCQTLRVLERDSIVDRHHPSPPCRCNSQFGGGDSLFVHNIFNYLAHSFRLNLLYGGTYFVGLAAVVLLE